MAGRKGGSGGGSNREVDIVLKAIVDQESLKKVEEQVGKSAGVIRKKLSDATEVPATTESTQALDKLDAKLQQVEQSVEKLSTAMKGMKSTNSGAAVEQFAAGVDVAAKKVRKSAGEVSASVEELASSLKLGAVDPEAFLAKFESVGKLGATVQQLSKLTEQAVAATVHLGNASGETSGEVRLLRDGIVELEKAYDLLMKAPQVSAMAQKNKMLLKMNTDGMSSQEVLAQYEKLQRLNQMINASGAGAGDKTAAINQLSQMERMLESYSRTTFNASPFDKIGRDMLTMSANAGKAQESMAGLFAMLGKIDDKISMRAGEGVGFNELKPLYDLRAQLEQTIQASMGTSRVSSVSRSVLMDISKQANQGTMDVKSLTSAFTRLDREYQKAFKAGDGGGMEKIQRTWETVSNLGKEYGVSMPTMFEKQLTSLQQSWDNTLSKAKVSASSLKNLLARIDVTSELAKSSGTVSGDQLNQLSALRTEVDGYVNSLSDMASKQAKVMTVSDAFWARYNKASEAGVLDLTMVNKELSRVEATMKRMSTAKNPNTDEIARLKKVKDELVKTKEVLSGPMTTQVGDALSKSTDRLGMSMAITKDKASALKQEVALLSKEYKRLWAAGASVQELQPIQNQIKSLQGQVLKESQTSGFGASILNMGKFAGWALQWTLLYSGIRTIENSIKNTVAEMVEFDKEMRHTNTIARLSADEYERMKDAVREMSTTSSFGFAKPSEVAQGLYFVESAGVKDSAQALDVLTQASQLAIGTQGELENSVKGIISMMNIYGRETMTAGRAADLLFATIDAALPDMKEFAEAQADLMVAAELSKVNFDELGAAFATLTRVGFSAQRAGTGLKNVMSSLLQPQEELNDTILGLGYASGQSMLQTLGLKGTLMELWRATNGNVAEFKNMMGSMRASGAAVALIAEEGANFQNTWDEIKKTTSDVGAASRASAEQMKMLGSGVKEFWSMLRATIMDEAGPLMRTLQGLDTVIGRLGTAGNVRRLVKDMKEDNTPKNLIENGKINWQYFNGVPSFNGDKGPEGIKMSAWFRAAKLYGVYGDTGTQLEKNMAFGNLMPWDKGARKALELMYKNPKVYYEQLQALEIRRKFGSGSVASNMAAEAGLSDSVLEEYFSTRKTEDKPVDHNPGWKARVDTRVAQLKREIAKEEKIAEQLGGPEQANRILSMYKQAQEELVRMDVGIDDQMYWMQRDAGVVGTGDTFRSAANPLQFFISGASTWQSKTGSGSKKEGALESSWERLKNTRDNFWEARGDFERVLTDERVADSARRYEDAMRTIENANSRLVTSFNSTNQDVQRSVADYLTNIQKMAETENQIAYVTALQSKEQKRFESEKTRGSQEAEAAAALLDSKWAKEILPKYGIGDVSQVGALTVKQQDSLIKELEPVNSQLAAHVKNLKDATSEAGEAKGRVESYANQLRDLSNAYSQLENAQNPVARMMYEMGRQLASHTKSQFELAIEDADSYGQTLEKVADDMAEGLNKITDPAQREAAEKMLQQFKQLGSALPQVMKDVAAYQERLRQIEYLQAAAQLKANPTARDVRRNPMAFTGFMENQRGVLDAQYSYWQDLNAGRVPGVSAEELPRAKAKAASDVQSTIASLLDSMAQAVTDAGDFDNAEAQVQAIRAVFGKYLGSEAIAKMVEERVVQMQADLTQASLDSRKSSAQTNIERVLANMPNAAALAQDPRKIRELAAAYYPLLKAYDDEKDYLKWKLDNGKITQQQYDSALMGLNVERDSKIAEAVANAKRLLEPLLKEGTSDAGMAVFKEFSEILLGMTGDAPAAAKALQEALDSVSAYELKMGEIARMVSLDQDKMILQLRKAREAADSTDVLLSAKGTGDRFTIAGSMQQRAIGQAGSVNDWGGSYMAGDFLVRQAMQWSDELAQSKEMRTQIAKALSDIFGDPQMAKDFLKRTEKNNPMTKAVTSLLEQGFNSPEVSNSVVKGFHDMSLKMADSFTDAFMEIIDQGKSFEQSMGDMVRRIAVEWERELLSKMFKQGANWLTNAIFGGVGIGSDGLANMGDFNQPTTIAAANGGIFPGSFQAFANGGVASRPTVGLIAEAGRPEAVVPLPNGRSIPVQMQGASRPQEVKSTTVVVFDRQQLSQLRTGKNEIINYVVADLRANGPIRQSIKRTI